MNLRRFGCWRLITSDSVRGTATLAIKPRQNALHNGFEWASPQVRDSSYFHDQVHFMVRTKTQNVDVYTSGIQGAISASLWLGQIPYLTPFHHVGGIL